ncbi:prostatic acid phosphatase-like [Argiope bruennichi]|uniref:prostatic acid phosphatase-like n=1 Tax=Argiope bruennichi TaxID=94029 RepID=UPI0024948602|nr:prostatic acid phosphatase-like [Argiope bruennichi]
MAVTTSAAFRRLLVPCIRRRRLLLFIVILYGIATFFLRDQIWNVFSLVRSRTSFVQIATEEIPRRKLIFLQLLFRHGHHSPFSSYPKDPIPDSYWVEGMGQLTKLGRFQHYVMGKYLREMYKGFLSSNVQEVDCMSSITFRSLFAAYAFLAGFYPAPEDKKMGDDLSYQPIACSFLPLNRDKYLNSLPNCPASELDKSVMIRSKGGKKFMEGYQDLYRFWSEHSGLPVDNYGAAGSLYKTLLAEKTENLTIPSWAESTWEALEKNSNICYHFHFKTRLLHRLRAGPVLEKIIGKMKEKIQNPNSKLKVYVYSGHGSNVAAILNALLVFNDRIPTYASTILFELYEEVGGNHSIRLLLTNATEPEKHITPPYILQLPGCSEYCPLEELQRQTADLYPLNWEKECQEADHRRIKQLLKE